MRLISLSAFCLVAACVVPSGVARDWGTVTVDGVTYPIDAQPHTQSDNAVISPYEEGEEFDLYFVTVDGNRVECGTRAGADRDTVLRACAARVRALLAPPPDDDDDDGGYRPPT